MLFEAADNPSEGVLAGGAELTDNFVRLLEDSMSGRDSILNEIFSPKSQSLPSGFPEATIGADGFTFGPQDAGVTALPGADASSMMPLGDSMNSLMQSGVGMPGGMGIINSFFQFLGAFLMNMTPTLNPAMLAQQAQATAMSNLQKIA